jgi:predicted AAA+ superfamily ATPase
MNHTKRKLAKNILFSLKNNPVTFLNGPRQAGKSTLVRDLANKDYPAEYLSFDNATHMAAASRVCP